MRVKAHELRNKSKPDLENQLTEFKTELSQLRVARVTGGPASKLSKIRIIRKSIARVLTVINQKKNSGAREFMSKKFRGRLPKRLRPKKTRALRRALTKSVRFSL